MNGPVLFLPSNDNGARTVLPVWSRLHERGFPTCLWTMDGVKGEGAGRVLPAAARDLGGSPFPPPRTRIGPLDDEARAFHWAVRHGLRKERPALLVLTNDWGWPENLALSAAAAEGIQTVLLQDGMLDLDVAATPAWQRGLWGWAWRMGLPTGPLRPVYGANGATWHLVQGRDFARRSRRLGVPRDRIFVVGQPRYDALLASAGVVARRRDRCRVLVALCASAAYGFMSEREYAEQLRAVAMALLALPWVDVVIKPHPRCAKDTIRRATDGHLGDQLTLAPVEDSLDAHLQQCDVVLTDISSAGLEGLLLGKTVITMPSFFPRQITLSYDRHRLSLVAHGVDELPDLLSAWRHDAPMVRAIHDRFRAAIPDVCAHPGHAASRAAAVLRRLARGRR